MQAGKANNSIPGLRSNFKVVYSVFQYNACLFLISKLKKITGCLIESVSIFVRAETGTGNHKEKNLASEKLWGQDFSKLLR